MIGLVPFFYRFYEHKRELTSWVRTLGDGGTHLQCLHVIAHDVSEDETGVASFRVGDVGAEVRSRLRIAFTLMGVSEGCGHGLPKVSPRPFMRNPSTPCALRGSPTAGRASCGRLLPLWTLNAVCPYLHNSHSIANKNLGNCKTGGGHP
jgi:hypothetical protein